MTSKSLYFKLLRENLKRRAWAIALAVLGFFFSLPIHLALTMENAIKTDFWRYNNYQPLTLAQDMPEAERVARILEIKTQIVLESVSFGNGLVAFLIIVAALVIGVSSFSYLHNRRKVDFYHSIPVRRELLFSVQYTGGFLIVALAYLLNLLFEMAVSCAYGVGFTGVLGAALLGWGLNLLFFLLMYAVVAIAMVMTGNMLVGILGSGVFFFYIPGMVFLIMGYFSTFFDTVHPYFMSGEGSPFMFGLRWTSPIITYIMALSWGGADALKSHVPTLIIILFTAIALTLLALELYRKRPSEAAGRAMAFKRSMMPIRVLLVFAFGLAGGMFFWMLQSTILWLVFGAVMSCVISHCVVEIIYHFDFKKLFAHKLQLAGCLVLVLLVMFMFRFDWLGYDSYLPNPEKVESVALEVGMDDGWVNYRELEQREDGQYRTVYQEEMEIIPEHMKLTQIEPVLAIAGEGRDRAMVSREKRLNSYRDHVSSNAAASFIVGYDGDSDESHGEHFMTQVSVAYTLKGGRKVYRIYSIPLSEVMDSYKTVYSEDMYKEGIYFGVLDLKPEDLARVSFAERGKQAVVPAGEGAGAILDAYKADLLDLTVDQRLSENPIGTVRFVTRRESAYADQLYKGDRGVRRGGMQYYDSYSFDGDVSQKWPVYPSFERTLKALEAQGIAKGGLVPDDTITSVTIDMASFMRDRNLNALEDEELEKMYPKSGASRTLVFENPESIKLLMSAFVEEDHLHLNGLCPGESSFYLMGETRQMAERDRGFGGYLQADKITPEILKLFEGTPLYEYSASEAEDTASLQYEQSHAVVERPVMAD